MDAVFLFERERGELYNQQIHIVSYIKSSRQASFVMGLSNNTSSIPHPSESVNINLVLKQKRKKQLIRMTIIFLLPWLHHCLSCSSPENLNGKLRVES